MVPPVDIITRYYGDDNDNGEFLGFLSIILQSFLMYEEISIFGKQISNNFVGFGRSSFRFGENDNWQNHFIKFSPRPFIKSHSETH